MKIKKGDKVKVISGKDLGKEAEVTKVLIDRDMIVVNDVNIVTRHVKGNSQREGGLIKINKPIHVSNVMLIDPKSKKITRVGYKIVDGKKYRFAKSSGELIDK